MTNNSIYRAIYPSFYFRAPNNKTTSRIPSESQGESPHQNYITCKYRRNTIATNKSPHHRHRISASRSHNSLPPSASKQRGSITAIAAHLRSNLGLLKIYTERERERSPGPSTSEDRMHPLSLSAPHHHHHRRHKQNPSRRTSPQRGHRHKGPRARSISLLLSRISRAQCCNGPHAGTPPRLGVSLAAAGAGHASGRPMGERDGDALAAAL